jgi:predicted HD phosphohydrolase
MNITDEILAIFGQRGSDAYFGESVSMTEHALQAAYFAQAAGAPKSLIVAALLHDIGHLIEEVPSDLADWTFDAHHERSAASGWLGVFTPKSRSRCVCMSPPSAIFWPRTPTTIRS